MEAKNQLEQIVFFEDKNFNEKPDLEDFSKKNWKINFFKITPEDVINHFDEILLANDGPFPGLPTIGKNLLIKVQFLLIR